MKTGIWFDTDKVLIGGRWQPPASGKTLMLLNPSDGTPLAPIARGGAEDIDAAVQAAARKKAAEGTVMTDDERRKLVSTEQSLGMSTEPKLPSGLELFTGDDTAKASPADFSDAESFFNLPDDDSSEAEDDSSSDEDDR